jgi:hypothetical protein
MNETYRKISLVFEVERAIKYLKLGLAEVQKISAVNDFYDPVFLYLSKCKLPLFGEAYSINRLTNNFI